MLSLTYFSSATRLLDADELAGLLAHIRPRNAALDVTGMLLYSDGNFVQTLEGPDAAVRSIFAGITADPRHHGIFVALEDAVTVRAFPDWSMGFRDVSGTAAADLEGFSTFLRDVRAGKETEGAQDAAHQLLRVFGETVG